MKLTGTMDIDSQGVLNIGQVSVMDLVRDFGTPLLVIDEVELRNNLKKYLEVFRQEYRSFRVLYAGKAFLNRTLCKILAEEGAGLDVVSAGELYIALQAGFPPENIYFHGNNKQADEIKMALENKVGRFVIDNYQEAFLINKLAGEMGVKARALIRITPGIEAHTHEFIQTGQIDSKFGVSLAKNQAFDLVKIIVENYPNIELAGVHAHIGSQILELKAYSKLIEVMFDFMGKVRRKTGNVLYEMDLGGGLGISYMKKEKAPAIDKYIKMIIKKVVTEARERNFPMPQIIVEPGRSVIGSAGTTLYTVGSIKKVPKMSKYVAIDGGMTDNIRPALYGASYSAFLANRCKDKARDKVIVAGRNCETGDILIKDIKLPEAQAGDILAVPCTGAYSYAMSSNYNGVLRPAVVMVKDGQARLVNRREKYEDLLHTDIIPEDMG